jgi:hypothetical protein
MKKHLIPPAAEGSNYTPTSMALDILRAAFIGGATNQAFMQAARQDCSDPGGCEMTLERLFTGKVAIGSAQYHIYEYDSPEYRALGDDYIFLSWVMESLRALRNELAFGSISQPAAATA